MILFTVLVSFVVMAVLLRLILPMSHATVPNEPKTTRRKYSKEEIERAFKDGLEDWADD